MKNLDPTLERYLTTSSYGLQLEDRHFYAVYKTRLVRYYDEKVGSRGHGDIVSITGLFAAADEDDARERASTYFDLRNPSFNNLNKNEMDVKHTLLDVKEIVVPDFREDSFKVVHRFHNTYDDFYTQLKPKIRVNHGEPIPEPFLGGYGCSPIIRRMAHLTSEKANSYLYHPWQGGIDNHINWYECRKGTENYYWLEREFNNRFSNEEKRFKNTEYADLDGDEQEPIRHKTRLNELDSQHAELLCLSSSKYYEAMKQGRFVGECGGVVFIPDEFNGLRNHYLNNAERGGK